MDKAIVYALQSLIGRSWILDAMGIFLASVLIWIEAVGLVVFWLINRQRRILALVSALLAAALAWYVNQGIGLIWFRPRPFADLPGVRELIAKSALDKSFPSDHAATAFALAFAVFLVNRRWGMAFLAAAALICLGRVYVGVHYPSDVVAGALVGIVCALVIHFLIHKTLRTSHKIS